MEEIHKRLQDLDPRCSPHLEERWIGKIVDLDLLFQIPEVYARIKGGIEGGASSRGSRMEEKACKTRAGTLGKKGPIL